MNSADIANLLRQSSSAIAELLESNRELRAKIAAREEQDRAEDLIARMDERGVDLGVKGRTTREKAASLVDSGRSLDAITEALNMYPGEGSPFKLDGARGTDRSRSRLTDTILEMGN